MVIDKEITLRFRHRIIFTRDVFSFENDALATVLGCTVGTRSKVLLFADDQLRVGDEVISYFERNTFDLVTPPIELPGGEFSKNDWSLVERVWKAVHQHQLCRQSFVIAVGGGAILDLVGFASATAHRGIRHVRLPTTTLSQCDGGVGVKNGVNYFSKKNWIGSFAVPHTVINDFRFLETLSSRDKRSGIIEAVKVALIRDHTFFEAIEALAPDLKELKDSALEAIIEESAKQHVDHIVNGGDPFEHGSARPLDFGHWAAHKVEQLSVFSVTHGEAVAIGIALDLHYSVKVGLLKETTADRILALIVQLGFQLYVPCLDLRDSQGRPEILHGLAEFREHLGGVLSITLVCDIGHAIEVHEVEESAVLYALEALRRQFGA